MVEEVGLYCPPGRPPRCVVLGQEEQVAALLADVDVVIYASGSEAILERLPEGVARHRAAARSRARFG